jgi:transcriptional regulator GlxA family with amidase domain
VRHTVAGMSATQFAHALHAVEPSSPSSAAGSNGRRRSRRELVARVNAFVRDHLADPVSVAALSRIAGVSERTLRAAYHDVLGLSPKQYAIRQRLCAVRTALAAAAPGTTTVTDVAMEYGFYELGRFAGRYRHTFGEPPSQTLRHAGESWPERVA